MDEKEVKYTPQHIANFFLYRAKEEGIHDVTPMKLIKLVYIAYAWNFALYGKSLFNECIEPWQHGPVIPTLYHEFKNFKSDPITGFAHNYDLDTRQTSYPVVDSNDDELLSVLANVWSCYKNKTGSQLRDITHAENSAWSKARVTSCNMKKYPEEIKTRALQAINNYLDSID